MLPFIIGTVVVAGVVYALSRGKKHSSESHELLQFHIRLEKKTLTVVNGFARPRIVSALREILRDEHGTAHIYLYKDGSVDIDGDISDSAKQRIRNTIAAEM